MLCVAPDFSMYKFYSSICEVECDTFIKSDDLSIDTDALIEKVNRDNIKLLLFQTHAIRQGREWPPKMHAGLLQA